MYFFQILGEFFSGRYLQRTIRGFQVIWGGIYLCEKHSVYWIFDSNVIVICYSVLFYYHTYIYIVFSMLIYLYLCLQFYSDTHVYNV